MTATQDGVTLIRQTVEEIRPLLARKPPEIQGAVLADLLALWLAGHAVIDDDTATAAMREVLLSDHLAVVRQLIPVNHKIIQARLNAGRRDRPRG